MGRENFPEKHTLLNALGELIDLADRQENRFAAELLRETKERFEKKLHPGDSGGVQAG